MKKQFALGLAGIMMISMLTGCKNQSYLMDVTYSDYVKLCEYKGVEATKVTYDVTDEEIQEAVTERMYEFVTYDPVTDRGVEIGDYANIDYTATIDNQENEGYSGEGEDILVGEGYIYPEVEDALVGMKAGENKTVEVELTEEYADDDDIGKKASVEVTLNEISVENFPEYNDDFVKENTDYDSVAAYEEALKKELMDDKYEEYKYVAVGEIINFLLDNSEFDGYPEELYTQCEENYDNENAYNASMYGMELEDFMELFGIDEDTRKQEIQESVNTELIIGAIAQAEKIKCSKDEIDEFVEDIYEDYEYESPEEFLEDYSEEEVGYEVVYEKVVDFLYENAKYVEITEEQYMEEQEAEDSEWLEMEEEEETSSDDDAVTEETSAEDEAVLEEEGSEEAELENEDASVSESSETE